ncbi:hydroxypyruvate isomerase [Actinoplanes italicus]|uniref:Hydroxypyruvate isomerase n=1 Tax=Actinoplanes italicus TaxID=113567 RepID=A0A2T0JYL7_9ACTN|nr:TIM barrel protein [Actinoplanes italicus]PRX14635.1 hydroxypyruvate isomerase [Actinoplanes italicus]GIE34498.1 hydroxypyruvate isomerase [Actinoplanes italicus]
MTAHHLRYDVNCSILFTDLPLLKRPAAAKAAGFDAVEFWWPFDEAVPPAAEVNAFVEAVGDAGVQLAGLNFFAGDMPGGDRGVLSSPAHSAEFRDNAELVAAIGAATGCRSFNALYGNRIAFISRELQDETAVANLAFAAETVARIGGTVLVEPVSGPFPYLLRTAADVIAVLDRVRAERGVRNLEFLADLYHLTVNGDDLSKVLAEHVERIGHVQIADAPGRHEPGTGGIDIDGHLSRLEQAGYRGRVGLEYVATEPGFAWLPRERRAATVVPANEGNG